MRVLYITHSSEVEGSGLALLNIVNDMKQQGIEPVAVFPKDGPLLAEFGKNGIDYKIIRFFSSGRSIKTKPIKHITVRLYGFVINILAILKLICFVKHNPVDIIHSNTGIVRVGYYLSKYLHIPHVWHLREYQTLDFNIIPYGGVKGMRILFAKSSNHCVSITKGIYDYYQLKEPKDSVIYDGVYSQSYSSVERKKKNHFLFVGSLTETKGVLDLIDAFKVFVTNHPDIELWLAGRDVVGIDSIIRNSGLSQIKYLGVRKDVYVLMSESMALIVPSFFEGFGFIIAEAMINHCLVIGRDTAGTKEQFDNGVKMCGKEIGLRFNSVEQLVAIMDEVVRKDITKYNDMIENAYRCAKRYTIEENSKNIINIYNKIWKEKRV